MNIFAAALWAERKAIAKGLLLLLLLIASFVFLKKVRHKKELLKIKDSISESDRLKIEGIVNSLNSSDDETPDFASGIIRFFVSDFSPYLGDDDILDGIKFLGFGPDVNLSYANNYAELTFSKSLERIFDNLAYYGAQADGYVETLNRLKNLPKIS